MKRVGTYAWPCALRPVGTAVLITLLGLGGGIGPAVAGPFTGIRLGDVDGFGYGTASGYQAANGGSANVDGAGTLGIGDFLPDVNNDGKVDEKNGDSFDWRSAAEIAGNSLTGSGFTNRGSTGSQYTDSSFSGKSQFAVFTFDFTVNAADIDPATSVYFNLVYGDFDTGKTTVQHTLSNASSTIQSLKKEGNSKANDGKIQEAYTTFAFDDIFTPIDGGYAGYLEVAFLSNDDFLTVDFAELGVTNVTASPAGAPEPHVWAMLAIGTLGLFGYRKWRTRATEDICT